MARVRVLISVAALLLMVGACGDSDETSSSEGTTTTTSPDCALAECVAALVPGSSAVPCEGVVYDLGIPEECFATPCGLIVDFHPAGVTGEQTDAYTNMKALGNAAGYVVVQPNTLYESLDPTGAMAAGRDRVFLDALIGAPDIDLSRVHVGGASLGGYQTWHFVCDHADLIASAAPHASGAGNTPGESCDFDENRSPAEQVDILMLHGRKDSTVPIERGVTQLEFDWTTPTGEGHCYRVALGAADAGSTRLSTTAKPLSTSTSLTKGCVAALPNGRIIDPSYPHRPALSIGAALAPPHP